MNATNPTSKNNGQHLPPPQAIILAAGRGKRMGGDKPKVLYTAAGHPLVWWVVRACREAGVQRCIIVVGHGGEEVHATLADIPGCTFVEQGEQLGTGHATRVAQPLFEGSAPTDVFVLAGDAPLLRPETLWRILEAHRGSHAHATLATSVLEDPTGYGRVERNDDGSFHAIVEHKDASPEQLAIKEVNPSYYCFRSDELFDALRLVKNRNAQHEYYVTDVPRILRDAGKTVTVVDAVPPDDIHGVNTQDELERVDGLLRKRHPDLIPSHAAQ